VPTGRGHPSTTAPGGGGRSAARDTPATRPLPTATTGRGIVVAAWGANALFAATVVPDAFGIDAFGTAADVVCLTLFLVSLPVWLYAFGKAVARTARGDDIVVANLFFLQGSAPRPVRWHLLGATACSVALAGTTAAWNPLAVLVPMLPLGLAGLWGARHGAYFPREGREGSRRS